MQPEPEPHASGLRGLLPASCGVVVYARRGAPPWGLELVLGDVPGVLGVPEEAVREVWAELVHPDDAPRVLAATAGLGPGDRVTLEYRVRTGVGGERWVRDTVCRSEGSASAGHVVGVLRDVSVERTLRAQVGALEERIWRAQRVDSLGAVAAGVAHDLSNVLTTAVSALQQVEAAPDLPEPLREGVAVAMESAVRGSEFVRQIVRFAAREDARSGPVDLDEVVEHLRPILARSLGSQVSLVVRRSPGLPRLHCEAAQIEQVLLNLAVNAGNAMPSGGRLELSTERVRLSSELDAEGVRLPRGEYVVLSIADTGVGMPVHVRTRIFEPFFSTEAGKRGGAGIGLSSVQRIVRGHGGGITVQTIEGRGTTFRIYLPLGERAPGIPELVAPPAVVACRGRILVVDGDEGVREVMKKSLARQGFAVAAAGTAAQALRLFDTLRPGFDLVVAELFLPDRPGPELLRALRRRVPGLPAVCASGSAGEAAVQAAREADAHYVEKPFTPSRLAQVVESALERAARSRRGLESTGA